MVVAATASCGDNLHGNISIDPGPWGFALGELVALTPDPGLAIGTDGDFRIAVVDDATLPAEGYEIEADATTQRVHAHDVLGAQYGVAEALENLGFRFRHPFDTYVPEVPDLRVTSSGLVHQPEVRVRGLQLHTLHPIEGYFALWEPSPGSANDAHRIINWLIANRGNFLQWVALERHPRSGTSRGVAGVHARADRLRARARHSRRAQLRAIRPVEPPARLSISSDDRTGTVPLADEVAARLPLITQDLPFDVYALSFGEFFDADPQQFIDATNEVAHQLRTLAPAAEMHAVVHVGATQRVTYMGQRPAVLLPGQVHRPVDRSRHPHGHVLRPVRERGRRLQPRRLLRAPPVLARSDVRAAAGRILSRVRVLGRVRRLGADVRCRSTSTRGGSTSTISRPPAAGRSTSTSCSPAAGSGASGCTTCRCCVLNSLA